MNGLISTGSGFHIQNDLPEEAYNVKVTPASCARYACAGTFDMIRMLAAAALFIVGCIAVAGGLASGSAGALGASMIAFGGGAGLLALPMVQSLRSKVSLAHLAFRVINIALYTSLGALGIAGVLSTHQMGIALIVLGLTTSGIATCFCYADRANKIWEDDQARKRAENA